MSTTSCQSGGSELLPIDQLVSDLAGKKATPVKAGGGKIVLFGLLTFFLITGYALLHIAAAAFLVWYGMTQADFSQALPYAIRDGLILGCGGLLLVLLILPLFKKSPTVELPKAISRSEEPTLYSVTNAIAKAIQAQSPDEIEIDSLHRVQAHQVNGKLRLSIGMPLFAALTVAQMGGLIAATLSDYLTLPAEKKRRGIISLANCLDAKCAGLNAKPLEILSWFIGKIADSLRDHAVGHRTWYNLQVQGSEQYVQTELRLWQLDAAHTKACIFLKECKDDGLLPDDWTQLLQAHLEQPTPEQVQRFQAEITAGTGAPAEGLLDAPMPSRHLLQNPASVSKAATLRHYKEREGINTEQYKLASTRTIYQERKEYSMVEKWYTVTWQNAYILFTLGIAIPTEFSIFTASGEVDKEKLANAWLQFRANHPEEVELTGKYQKSLSDLVAAEKIKLLHAAGIHPGAGFGELEHMSAEEIETTIASTKEELDDFVEGDLAETHHQRTRTLALICVNALTMIPETKREPAIKRMRLAATVLQELAAKRHLCENLYTACAIARMVHSAKGSVASHAYHKAEIAATEQMDNAFAPILTILEKLPCPLWVDFEGNCSEFVTLDKGSGKDELARRIAHFDRLNTLMNCALTDVSRIVGPWLLKFGSA